ncbi:LamG domain-containing protein [Ekhidna sp.]|uniref:LamG domain-containing protein n=1 Tax=Ekhidna sp. TaxID=2608089 RepID=UPI00329A3036
MKKLILSFIVVCICCLTSCFQDYFPPHGGGGGSDPELPDPVAYYKFNENALDETSNNDGEVNGANFVASQAGEESSAIQFDGIDDFVQIPRSEDVNFGNEDFTISLMAKTSTSDEGVLLSTRNTSSCSQASGPTVTLAIGSDRSFRATLRGSNNVKYGIISSIPVNEDEWTLLTLSREGGLIRMYVESEETQLVISETTDFTTSSDLYLGRTIYCSGNYLNATLDELQIFDKYVDIDTIIKIYD